MNIAEQHVAVAYRFTENQEKVAPRVRDLELIPSINNHLKNLLKDGQKNKRVTFNLAKSFSGLDKSKNTSFTSKITQTHKISHRTLVRFGDSKTKEKLVIDLSQIIRQAAFSTILSFIMIA